MAAITIFKSIYDKIPYTIQVSTALKRIQQGNSKDAVIKLRAEKDENAYKTLKLSLPAITFSGEFKERNDDALVRHSGYVCLDFDKIAAPELFKKELAKNKYIYAAWISPSGNGVKALIKIADLTKHNEHYESIIEDFKCDPSCKNVGRVCFESYDPEIIINEEAKIYQKTYGKILQLSDSDKFKNLFKWLTDKGDAFREGERNIFIFKLASACCRFGVPQSECEHLMLTNFPVEKSFTQHEAISAIKSAYKNNPFDTCIMDGGVVFEKDGGLEVNPDIFNLELKPKDIIYASDCMHDILDLFQNGWTEAETTYIPDIDKIWKWKRGDLNILTGYGNHGKALDINTEIPTINGFKLMKDIQIGDVLFDELGNPCNVTNVTDIMTERECYNIKFNDGTEIIADADHQWVTSTYKSRFSIRTAKRNNRNVERGLLPHGTDQRHKREYKSTKTTKDIANSLMVNGEYNHAIDIAMPVNYIQKNNIIHPYVLGAWLGDGTSASGGFSSNDVQIIDTIRGCGYVVNKLKGKYSYGIIGIKGLLRDVGVLNNKHIPLSYLQDSLENRLDLLRGLMDTDGYVSKDGICEFTTTKKELSENVYELICSLGIKARTYDCEARLNGRYISRKYRILFSTTTVVFNLNRKKERLPIKLKNKSRTIVSCNEHKSVPVKCIEVDSPSHLFLCTRSFVPTHNSAWLYYLCLIKAVKEGKKFCIFSPETYPAKNFYFDLCETYLGTNCTPGYSQPSLDLFSQAYEFVNDHFFYIYPAELSPTPEYLKERFLEMVLKERVDGCIIDPFNQMENNYRAGQREDQYLSTLLSDFSRFAKQNDIYFHIVAHPKTPIKGRDEKDYSCPSVFNLSGGAMWNNKADNIMVYHRPYYETDPKDPLCEIHTKKIKRQKEVGKPGMLQMRYESRTRRFVTLTDYTPLNDMTSTPLNEVTPITTDHNDPF